jgi:hypothetical protein
LHHKLAAPGAIRLLLNALLGCFSLTAKNAVLALLLRAWNPGKSIVRGGKLEEIISEYGYGFSNSKSC